MLTSPYSIYVNKRPLRIAFLIENKPESMEIVDTILAYNRDRWGGRYNPIVITDGQTLNDSWWSLLEVVDPDIIQAFVTLSDDLITDIDRRISPYLIQQPDQRQREGGQWRLTAIDNGLSILPTPLNVRIARPTIGESRLVLFETHVTKTDPLIKRLIEWNFGGYSRTDHLVRRALEDVVTQSFPVTDAASLVTPFNELSTFRSYTYPVQLCSIPKESLPSVDYDPLTEEFHIVIGDTPLDAAYFWNRPAALRHWYRADIRQVWLPLDVATNTDLTTVLSSLIQRLAEPVGTQLDRIRFVSLSLPEDRLQEIVEPLTCMLRIPRSMSVFQEIQVPKIGESFSGPPSLETMDLYRVSSTRERITLQTPDGLQGRMHDEIFMADLYIESWPERYPSTSGRSLWWQLPRQNSLAMQMFRRPSRILRTRYPSIAIQYSAPRLDITLPDDFNVFAMFAAKLGHVCYTRDARYNRIVPGQASHYEVRPSEKGRYLYGLLELFGGLHSATSCLEEHYWRRMFDMLSGRIAHKDAERIKSVGNRLRKRLRANRAQFYENDKDMTWLTNYVLDVARSLPTPALDLRIQDFEKHAEQEVIEYNERHTDQAPLEFSKADLMDAMARLTERGILQVGFRVRCPSCGYRAWYHIDDAMQTLRCGGCNAVFPMPPEQCWYYRLNSLARSSLAEHGLLPVVLVLGQLLMHAKSAFLFTPCLDLFETNNEGPISDLDIVAILDGQLIIGEVKQSRNLFDKATFVRMEGIARKMLPDILLFASMDREPTTFITKEIEQLAEVLQPLNITVKWFQIDDYKFDASPVI